MTNYPFFALWFMLYGSLIFVNNCQSCYGYFYDPEFQICDSTHLRKFQRNICASKLVFTSNSTKLNSDCICVSGIWIIINRDCIPSALVSNKGCILSPQIKAMQYLGALRKEDFFAIITQSNMDLIFSLLRPVQNANVNGQIWLFNGFLSKSFDDNFCAQKWQLSDNNNETVRTVKMITRFTVKGKLTVQYECPSRYTELMIPNLQYDLHDRITSECRMDCSKQTASKLIKRQMNESEASHRKSTSSTIKPMDFKSVKNTTLASKEISPSVKPLIHHLHRRFLIKMLSYGFSKDKFRMDLKPNLIPQSAFKILEKLQDIVYTTCADKVPKLFLELAYIMFLVAHESLETNLTEVLKDGDESGIIQFLNECQESIAPLKFSKGPTFCPDEVIKTVQIDDAYVALNMSGSYNTNGRHLSIEIPWNMIDLVLATCISAFAESYILYHKMEQALEKLFIKDLQTLWQHPPENGLLYTRIYGPNWKHYADNLERCVQFVYIRNPKLTRLQRPGEVVIGSKVGAVSQVNGSLEAIINPEITIEKHSEDAKITNKPKSILDSVNLTCQLLKASQCHVG